MTKPAHSLRDWLLFLGAALIPAIAVGALGLRALSNEEAAQRRAASEAMAAEAVRVRATLERGIDRAAATLERASEPERDRPFDAHATYEALRADAPPGLEPVILSAEGRIVEPRSTGRALGAGAATKDAADCAELVARAAKAEILARCEESSTSTGRHLWLSLALEALASTADAALVGRLMRWIDDHQGALRASERAGAREEIAGMGNLEGGARAALLSTLDAGTSSADEIARVLRADPVVRARASGRGTTRFQAPLGVGAVRPMGEGHAAAFVMTPTTLARALAAGSPGLALESADLVASVATGARVERDREAVEWVGEGLGVRVAARDGDALAARARRSKAILAGAALLGALAAAGLATFLFARMRAARRTSELRTSFVAAVSHELRTPIASVRMLAELLDEGRVEAGEEREVHAALAKEAKRLGDTVDRLLGFSRLAAGKLVLDRKRQRVAAPIEAAVGAFRERHPAAKVVVALDAAIEAEIDAGQIEVVVTNLLENALKYAPEGQPYAVSLDARRGAAELQVADRGPGIAKRHHARIFEAFERVDDRLHKATEGSGIGLSLVRQIARAHGGDAWVSDETEQGARFVVRIPIVDGAGNAS